jgi:cbb3-type cytochrome oxidase subunit 3
MKQEVLTQFPHPLLPTLAMLLFFAFFVGLLIFIIRRKNISLFQSAASLPLSDGELEEERKI